MGPQTDREQVIILGLQNKTSTMMIKSEKFEDIWQADFRELGR